MARRLSIPLVLAGAFAALGAGPFRVETTNFVVDAPTEQAARQIAQYAEVYRKEKAIQWLGREMPTWPARLPVRVTIQVDGAGGATTFEYGPEGVERQYMHIEGRYDRLLNSVLPHEITHTVFAHYYRCPVPRWADEGGSVLSEDQPERTRHDQLAKSILNTPGRLIPLRRLFALKEYPDDVMSLYAEGYSVSNFLVTQGGEKGRATFLNFVAYGMRNNEWDSAVKTYYGYRNVNELELAWVDSLRRPRTAPVELVNNSQPAEMATAQRVVSRQTAPPMQVTLEAPRPTYRGQIPQDEGDRFIPRPPATPLSRPSFPQDYPIRSGGSTVPAALAPRSDPPGPVLLGPPQIGAPPPVVLGAPIPSGTSPVGYPR
jgi:hypothetical protein